MVLKGVCVLLASEDMITKYLCSMETRLKNIVAYAIGSGALTSITDVIILICVRVHCGPFLDVSHDQSAVHGHAPKSHVFGGLCMYL